MAKRLIMGIIVVAVLALPLGGCAAGEETTTEAKATTTEVTVAAVAAEETQALKSVLMPSVAALPAVQDLSENAEIVLVGSGFEPGQEVRFLVTTEQEGVRAVSDYTYSADPAPMANDSGAWVTTFGAMGRLADKGVITEGVYNIMVTDSDNNPLARVAVAFFDSEKPQEEWPAWAQAADK